MNDNNQNLQRGIISLIRSAIENEPAILPDFFDWNEAMRIVESHRIAAIIYYGVHKSNIQLPSAIQVRLKQMTYEAVVIDECQTEEITRLFQELSAQNIDYMPLKGILLKPLYSNSEMRVMGDADILIRIEQYSIISKIMDRLGYTEILESDHELKWSKPPYMIIELHKRLIPSYNKDYYAYYGDGWRLAQRSVKNSNYYEMKEEDEFIYLFTHFAKHYRDSGIGIKHLVDFQVFKDKHLNLNYEYIQNELKKTELYQFYLNILETLQVWFFAATPSKMSDYITNRIFFNGAYGTRDIELLASALKCVNSGASVASYNRRKVFKNVLIPLKTMKKKYPLLDTMPVLLPLFWVLRVFTILLLHRDKVQKMRSDLKIITNERIDLYQDDLNYVGLDFRFIEREK